MNISEISIRRPVFAWMLMCALIIFGGISFTRMGISALPDVDFPVVNVSLSLTGAAPEVMETDVVDVVENAVMALEGVKQVTSTSKNGNANVSIEFNLTRNIEVAMQDVQAKIGEAQRRLPKEMDPPVITKVNPEDQPIMWVTLESDKYPLKDLMAYTRDHLQNQFATTEDVGDINLGGYVEPNLRIWVSAKDLNRYALSVSDVIATVNNEHSEPPAGYIVDKTREYNLRTLGEAKSVQEFENLLVNTRGGAPNFSPIALGKVARIEEGLADVRRVSRGMGKPAVGLGIRKQRGSNAVTVAFEVKKKIEKLRKTLPEGMDLGINYDSTRFISESVHELTFTLVLSALLTAAVCWMFLGSWSSTFNVLLSIPTSIVGTFIFLYFAGFTLNTFTLLGLSLAIGIVVDDAIMVLENIIRHREMGKSKVESAMIGAKEITFAAIAATISIMAIFLPVTFMQGIIGKFLFQFGMTMTVAVGLSLVEALTLTPMRCSQFVEAGERRTRLGKAFEHMIFLSTKTYSRMLTPVLNHKWAVVIGSVAFFVFSLGIAKKLNKEFVPAQDQSIFLVRVQTSIGSALDYTDGKMKEIEKYLAARKEVERYYVAIGGFGGGDVNTAIVFVTMKPKGQRGVSAEINKEPSQGDFMGICRTAFNKIPDVKAIVQDLSMRGFSSSRGFPIEFTLLGPSWDKLGELSQTMIAEMQKTGMVSDMDSDYQVGMPEIQITPDRAKAAARGVAITAIGQTINALIGGLVVGRYPKDGHRNEIRVKLLDEGGDRIQKLESLYVRNNRGELIPLSSLVNIQEKPSLQAIGRRNRERAISVYGNFTPGQSQQKVLEVVQQTATRVLPKEYRIAFTGGSESFKEGNYSMLFAFVLGIVIAYMVLASQFNSFIHPFTVLLGSMLFAISGAFFALLITKQSINLYSMIGIVLLMGIVKKNAILLVDFTNQMRATGLGVREALLRACPVRLRPILMTSAATVVGAIPAAIGVGPGAESRIPMAVVVIGGVLVSTLITLFLVPSMYLIFSKLERMKYETVEATLGSEKFSEDVPNYGKKHH